jgi:hypothetical protein
MPRHPAFLLPLLYVLLSAACGPDPVKPRALPDPPPETPPIEAGVPSTPPARQSPGSDGDRGAVFDAGGGADAGAPDAGVDAGDDVTPVDPGDDATPIDAGVETVAARAPVAGEIVIAEALVNPGGTDTGREWIEILSLADEPLDLSELHVADMAVDLAVPAAIIDAGARIVLGQSADTSKNGGAPISLAYGTRLGLNNDGEELSICVGPCAGGRVIDHLGWKVLGAAYDGHAVVFDREANLVCPATQPFGTAGDFGTPGGPNDACPVPDAGF